VRQPIDQEVVCHLLEAYGYGQTFYAVYKKLEQCCQQGNEKVFEFKISLEELLDTGGWTELDSKISERFASTESCAPRNTDSSLALRKPWLKSGAWERLRGGYTWRRLGATEATREQSRSVDKVARQKGAKKRARAGKP